MGGGEVRSGFHVKIKGRKLRIVVRFCPFCGSKRNYLRYLAGTADCGEPRSEDWRCDYCGAYFTISAVEKE